VLTLRARFEKKRAFFCLRSKPLTAKDAKGSQRTRRKPDRMSPADFYLNPGNYVVDITLTGFKSVHKVISVEKSGKVVIEENLDRE